MKLYLLDDDKLLNRKHSRRIYGFPKLAYRLNPDPDKKCQSPKVIKGSPLAPYLMYYSQSDGTKRLPEALVSDDCINWKALKGLGIKESNGELVPMYPGAAEEFLAAVYDENSEKEKYRLISNKVIDGKKRQTLLYSEDGLCFSTRVLDWNDEATEPVSNCFYNKEKKNWSLTVRRYWAERGAGIKETDDFVNFTKWRPVIMPDSEDLPMDEIYGMVGGALDELYIGLLSIYHTPYEENYPTKFWKGRMETQLVYSYDGSYFLRSLRRPFINTEDPSDFAYGGFYPYDFTDCGEYTVISGLAQNSEHGIFKEAIACYTVQKDRFCGLESLGGDAYLTTRPILYNGGDISINLSLPVGSYAEAVCQLKDRQNKAIEGFTFSDCLPFAGDEFCWEPKWRDHDISLLKGTIFMIEVRWFNGIIWTIEVDGKLIKSASELRLYR